MATLERAFRNHADTFRVSKARALIQNQIVIAAELAEGAEVAANEALDLSIGMDLVDCVVAVSCTKQIVKLHQSHESVEAMEDQQAAQLEG